MGGGKKMDWAAGRRWLGGGKKVDCLDCKGEWKFTEG